MNIMVPYADFLDNDDINVVFEGVFNNRTWNINQILNAGGIDEVFCQLYREAKGNIGKHGEVWNGFYEKASEAGHDYASLKRLLIEDGEIEEPNQSGVDEEPDEPI